MSTELKTEQITYEEYQARCKQQGRTIPVMKAKALVDIFDKDGKKKSTLTFTSEDVDNATQ